MNDCVVKVSKDITFEPREHQERSKKKLKKTDAMLFFHGMGTGKTLSSIYSSEGDVNVVTPAALRKNYERTVEKFDIGDPDKVKIKSYEQASKHGLSPKNTLVVDEIQRIGNSGSARSQSILSQAKRHKKRIALSGTPASNHPHELATVIRFLSPEAKDIPLNPSEFNKKFLEEKRVKIPLWKRLVGIEPGVEYDIKNEKVIKESIKGKVDYHKGGDFGFPDRVDEIKKVEMDDRQSKYYRYVTGRANPVLALKIRMNMPLSKKESKQLNAFMTAARQVSNTVKAYGGDGVSPKIKQVVEDVKQTKAKDKNFKNVIYSNYIGSGLEPVSEELKRSKIDHEFFTGKMNDKQKEKVVNDYNSGKIKTLLISGAGSEGLDLKGTKLMQIVEPHWNKNRIEQIVARGIRFKSHEHLPEKERVVKVIKYQSVLPKTPFQEAFNKKSDTSSDEYLEELSEKKHKLLSKFLNIFKEEGTKHD